MAHIACITNGLTGLLLASFEMVRRLRAAGHQITYLAPASARDAAIREGLSFEELPDLEVDAETAMAGFAARLKALSFDLVLIDTELPEAVLSAQAAGLKTVLLNTWMSIWKHPNLPPLHRSIKPGVGFHGTSLGMQLAWLRHLMTRRLMDAARALWHGRRYRVAAMRAYAERIGFPHRREFDFDNWLLPFSFRTMPILVLHAHEFEFPHKPRQHVHYAGPMVNPERREIPSNPDDQAKIKAVLARRSCGQSRLVFGGFGSFFSAENTLIQKITKAFAGRPDWELVVPLGNRSGAIDQHTLPANVHVVSWAPQLLLLSHADAAIVHGGINTIDECVHFGTPMLAYSGEVTDMPGNIARIVHHGLGVEGNAELDSPGTIAERLDCLMTNQHMLSKLTMHRAAAERYVKERILEKTIEAFLQGPLAASAEPLTSSGANAQRVAASTF